MFGFLGRFGRAQALRELDSALRAVDVHPALVPDAVELAAVRLLQTARPKPEATDYAALAELIGYCLIGAENFAGANDTALKRAVEARIEAAIDAGDSFDAKVILLLLHAGVVAAGVVARFELEAGA
jgi:hypothetical protein